MQLAIKFVGDMIIFTSFRLIFFHKQDMTGERKNTIVFHINLW